MVDPNFAVLLTPNPTNNPNNNKNGVCYSNYLQTTTDDKSTFNQIYYIAIFVPAGVIVAAGMFLLLLLYCCDVGCCWLFPAVAAVDVIAILLLLLLLLFILLVLCFWLLCVVICCCGCCIKFVQLLELWYIYVKNGFQQPKPVLRKSSLRHYMVQVYQLLRHHIKYLTNEQQ